MITCGRIEMMKEEFFYVAMTRAKENLYIVPSTSPYEYEEILR